MFSTPASLTLRPSSWGDFNRPRRKDQAEAQEKALAEHVARHPEDVGRTVEDFKWIMRVIVKWPREAGDPPLD
jgi:hypothetical protein